MFSQNWLNPIIQRAKTDRSVRRALPVYDNEKFSFERHCSLHFVSTEVYRYHKINNYTLFFALNVFLSERLNFADYKISI